jgi:hypothetical protein
VLQDALIEILDQKIQIFVGCFFWNMEKILYLRGTYFKFFFKNFDSFQLDVLNLNFCESYTKQACDISPKLDFFFFNLDYISYVAVLSDFKFFKLFEIFDDSLNLILLKKTGFDIFLKFIMYGILGVDKNFDFDLFDLLYDYYKFEFFFLHRPQELYYRSFLLNSFYKKLKLHLYYRHGCVLSYSTYFFLEYSKLQLLVIFNTCNFSGIDKNCNVMNYDIFSLTLNNAFFEKNYLTETKEAVLSRGVAVNDTLEFNSDNLFVDSNTLTNFCIKKIDYIFFDYVFFFSFVFLKKYNEEEFFFNYFLRLVNDYKRLSLNIFTKQIFKYLQLIGKSCDLFDCDFDLFYFYFFDAVIEASSSDFFFKIDFFFFEHINDFYLSYHEFDSFYN